MNVISNFTKRNLMRNRKRTVVTIIGVMLSTALICTVVGMAATFRASMIEDYKQHVGNYHAQYYDVPAEISGLITENAHTELAGILSNLGMAAIEDEKRVRNYVNISGANDTLFTQMNVELLEGRLPENDSELVIPSNYSELSTAPKLGDTVTYALGDRYLVSDGSEVKPKQGEYDEEQLAIREEKTFCVVGIAKDLSKVDGYMAPAYLCLFRQNEFQDGDLDVYVRIDQPSESNAIFANLQLQLAAEGYTDYPNLNNMVMYEGGLSERSLKMVFGLGLVVCLIIIGTSVFVIANGFRISVEDKKVQFGMLASVGATKRQIRNIVLREGAYIFVIGTTAGIALGAFVIWVLDQVVNLLLKDMINMKMVYTLPWWVVLSTILMSAVTIYFASIIPAHAAMKISPIDIIRGRNRVRVYEEKLHAGKWIRKYFGMGGVIAKKNLQRTRKKYRTTVISLVVGMAVFIGINSFVGYGKRLVGEVYTKMSYNVMVSAAEDVEKAHRDYEKIRHLSSVRRSIYGYECTGRLSANTYARDVSEFGYENEDEDEDEMLYLNIVVLPENYFREYLSVLKEENADITKVGVLADHRLYTDEEGVIHHGKGTNVEDGDSMTFSYVSDYLELTNEQLEGGADPEVLAERTVELLRVTDEPAELPFTYENIQRDGGLILFVCDGFFDRNPASLSPGSLFLDSEDPDDLELTIRHMKENAEIGDINVYNEDAEAGASRRLILVVEIFLYGFITVIALIGVTNVFNTITTNMNLRRREFAMLRSVGMTKREFFRMIRVEGAMYAVRSMVFGIPFGILLSWIVYLMIRREYDYGYFVPGKAILISILVVILIVGFCMWSAVRKLTKQNIIDTIRKQTY